MSPASFRLTIMYKIEYFNYPLAWKAELFRVPNDATDSNVSAPPNTFRTVMDPFYAKC